MATKRARSVEVCGRCGKTSPAVSFEPVHPELVDPRTEVWVGAKNPICNGCAVAWGLRLVRLVNLDSAIRGKKSPELLEKFNRLRLRLLEDEAALAKIEAKVSD